MVGFLGKKVKMKEGERKKYEGKGFSSGEGGREVGSQVGELKVCSKN